MTTSILDVNALDGDHETGAPNLTPKINLMGNEGQVTTFHEKMDINVRLHFISTGVLKVSFSINCWCSASVSVNFSLTLCTL